MVVTPYGENELYPSDVHINQNPGGRDFGLQKWIDRDANVENKDIVLWPSFGMT
jgi:primary-amine oxidase